MKARGGSLEGRNWPFCLSTAPRNEVTIFSKRHSGNLLAGIQKDSLDTGLRRYDELTVDSYLLTCTEGHDLPVAINESKSSNPSVYQKRAGRIFQEKDDFLCTWPMP